MWFAAIPLVASATEVGDSRPFGLGIQLGTPAGVSGKLYLGGRTSAIDFALGSAYNGAFDDSVFVQVSYHLHFTELTSGSGVAIPWRVGIGGWLASGGTWIQDEAGLALGARAPVGLDFDLESLPLQFYVEVALALSLVPGIDAGLDAGVGARYYF